MILAAGLLLLTPEKTALFLQRGPASDYPGAWCLPGGVIEPGETALQAAERECAEEIGKLPDGERVLLTRQVSPSTSSLVEGNGQRVSEGIVPPPPGVVGADVPPPVASAPVDFSTFLQRVPAEFEPDVEAVKREHVGYAWAPVEQPPEPLHPGVRIAIARLSMDELSVARAMAAGDLTSPQRYENVTLFDIRITGTRTAYRKALDEFAHRPPEVYLNEDFLARCNGLPVIWEHPKRGTLDSKEYADRNIGSVFLPYIKGDEVWAIAKIYDDAALQVMLTEDLSTSPSVVFRDLDTNTKLTLDNGSTLLIEGKPSLLDHLAICERGVWDKAGPPIGVVNTRADSISARVPYKKRFDAHKILQVANKIESLSSRFDGMRRRSR